MSVQKRVRAASRAVLFHFTLSLCVALSAAVLVFFVWYPFPFRDLAGGRELFFLIITVDVVCGPLLTMVLFNPEKSRRELILDLSLVVLIQVGALLYGIYTLALARPVYLVYEVDRFRVVAAADVQLDQLHPENGGMQILPWTGPKVIGVREPRDSEEKLKSLELSLQGIEPSVRPGWWVSYDQNKPQIKQRAKPVSVLRASHSSEEEKINDAVRQSGLKEIDLGWVPVTSFKSSSWIALIEMKTGEVKAFAPIDAF